MRPRQVLLSQASVGEVSLPPGVIVAAVHLAVHWYLRYGLSYSGRRVRLVVREGTDRCKS